MSNCARCPDCESDNVECTGTIQYGEDEYYCHECETYFNLDWDAFEDEDDEGEENYE